MSDSAESLRKTLSLYRGLVDVSALIASITDFDELIEAILEVARSVLRAEGAALFLANSATGNLEMVAAVHADGRHQRMNLEVPKGCGISGWVFEHGQPVNIPDAYADERFYREADNQTGFHTRSVLCAPLRRDGRIIGAIQVLNALDRPHFEAEDLDAFTAYAHLTATAIEKLQALERTREQQRVERDLVIASEIQKELLADALPSRLPHARFSAHTQPATLVGGDFYYVSPAHNGRVFFAIGDVSGKGIAASLVMAQVLSALEFVFRRSRQPAEALAELNTHLGERIVRGMFVTALAGMMEKGSRRVLLASAGHCPPLAAGTGRARPLAVQTGLPLGIRCGSQYPLLETRLEPGEWVVSYTDGLPESRGDGGDFEPHIARVAAQGREPQEIVARLVEAERAHRGEAPLRDDLTVLVGGPAE